MSDRQCRLAVILGARPNFIKAAPFFRELKKHPQYTATLIHTGQHFDDNMSKVFFDQMEIPRPDIMLSGGGTLSSEKIGVLFNQIQSVLAEKTFDAVVVFGDVNSTLAGALAAARCGYPLIHIESGLRSHDKRMPEEANRLVVDHLADFLFTTEPDANDNLAREGIPRERIFYVGNIMIESLEIFSSHIVDAHAARALNVSEKKYIVATFHRQENTDSPEMVSAFLQILNKIAEHQTVILPLHPGTKEKISRYGLEPLLASLRVVAPLGYFEFLDLIRTSAGVITDSGGIQEETTHLGIPCCTIRDNTERPITLTLGSNMLVDIKNPDIAGIESHFKRTDFKVHPIPLWDSHVSERIFAQLDSSLNFLNK